MKKKNTEILLINEEQKNHFVSNSEISNSITHYK